MEYNEDDFLMLSGLQHFKFCRRQWALIHIENLWAENYRTADGDAVHKRAHDPSFNESRGDTVIKRGVSVFSRTLGVSGACDVLEFHRDDKGITLHGREGRWKPFPVEYKRGSPRDDRADALQLCGQAMCLEEMLCCEIECGALYYNEIRRRVAVNFDKDLRDEVKSLLSEMHELYAKSHTPRVKPTKACNACSLRDLCVPRIYRARSVKEYIASAEEVSK